MQIIWLGHASFKIISKEGFVIYTDPFAGDESEYEEKADLVLISHEGYHHLSYEKERKIRTDTTVVLSTKQVAYEVNGTAINPGEEKQVGPVKIRAVHAYSTRPGIGKEKGAGLGFMIYADGNIIYFAGTTDRIPEMDKIVCDIALLPVTPTHTMSPRHAADAVKTIRPKLAIPMHYGTYGGTIEDAELFKELVAGDTGIPVEILEPGKSMDI